MKKFSLKDILIPSLALFLICTVATALLALTNGVTKEKINQVALKTAAEARQKVVRMPKPLKKRKTATETHILKQKTKTATQLALQLPLRTKATAEL